MALSVWCNYTLETKQLATLMILKGTGLRFQKLEAGISGKMLKKKEVVQLKAGAPGMVITPN